MIVIWYQKAWIVSDISFVIFKLGRSGSSALSVALDQVQGCSCIPEILNGLSDKGAAPSFIQSFIDERLGSLTETSKIGFTLNPFKSPSVDCDFWSFPKGRTNVVFNLTREAFEQTISALIADKVRMWPGNRSGKGIEQIDAFLNDIYELPEEEFVVKFRKTSKQTQKLTEFSREFAKINKAQLIEVEYRKLYQPPHTDIEAIEKALGLCLDKSFLDPALKVLPDYLLGRIRNLDRLRSLAV